MNKQSKLVYVLNMLWKYIYNSADGSVGPQPTGKLTNRNSNEPIGNNKGRKEIM